MEGSWDAEGVGRLVLAALFGGVLGLPSRSQPGGLRTHAMVCAGSALFALSAVHVAGPTSAHLVSVVQGVAGGIGFIGAATVLKRGPRIYGVSVASSIWISGAIGCEFGMGRAGFAVLAVLMMTTLNVLYNVLERKYVGFQRKVPVEGEPEPGGPQDLEPHH